MCLAPDTDAPLLACPRAQSGAQLTVANVWAAAEFVEDGVMSQVGFGALCERLQLEQMTFEAAFFMFSICPNIEDPMVVCSSKSDLQRAVELLAKMGATRHPKPNVVSYNTVIKALEKVRTRQRSGAPSPLHAGSRHSEPPRAAGGPHAHWLQAAPPPPYSARQSRAL